MKRPGMTSHDSNEWNFRFLSTMAEVSSKGSTGELGLDI